MAKGAHVEKNKGNISAEEQELLEDKEIWENETALHGAVYESRKRKSLGSNEDGLFIRHQKGPITSTFTAEWFLREGQGRELLGEWMKFISSTHRFSPPMLTTDPWGIVTVSGCRMEVFVCLRREIPPDYMG